MKTIGYYDRADGNHRIRFFNPMTTVKKNERIKQAFCDLMGLGNVVIVYIKGNKVRKIAKRGL